MVTQVRFDQFVAERSVGMAEVLGLSSSAVGIGFRLVRLADLNARDLILWDKLGAATQTESAYAQPWFMRHSLRHCDPESIAQLAIVATAAGDWLGVIPLIRAKWQGRAPLPSWHAWSHPNRFVGTPLVRAGAAHLFWHTLLRGLGEASQGEVALCLSDLAADDAVTQALFDVCAIEDRAMGLDRSTVRPILQPGQQPELPAKQRSRITALTRRMTEEFGSPEFSLSNDPERIAALRETFLTLEAAGWKGQGGSALGSCQRNRALFLAVTDAAAPHAAIEIAVLEAGGKVLALATQLVGKGRRYGFKMTYDEAASTCAPGLLLLDWLTQHGPGDLPFDSCSRPGAEPVSRLWPDRCELIDCRVALGGALRQGAMRVLLQAELLAANIKAHAFP
jgi:CelD/BcsL family acetyltransferase involved in cellulose biosynthesis